jgi:hypothetical protein
MRKTKTIEQFKEEMFKVNPNIKILGEYVNSTTKILVSGKICNHTWYSIPLNLLGGSGCPECARLNKIINKTGEINYNKNNEKMEIIKYIDKCNIDVEFEDGSVVKNRTYNSFKSGNIISPYCKIIYNIGYIGEGDYNIDYSKLKYNKRFMTWKGILSRCYNENNRHKTPTYKDCKVCEEWLNFQNFAQWYDESFYQIDNEIMALDKDILYKGNKIYSLETCCFVPQTINSLFTKCDKSRGDYPIGVYFDGNTKKFISSCRNTLLNKKIYLGDFLNPTDAFYKYKIYKEKHIKEIANNYRNQIPEKLYNSMYNWVVEITD